MNTDYAGVLYDALSSFESRYRKGAYPIHKSLSFADSEMQDIYDWILWSTAIPHDGAILDAGCGVGFGTLRIARMTGARVTGISVSRDEIDRATDFGAASALNERVNFKRESYDHLGENEFDAVVAIESLKHSPDLRRSLTSIVRSAKPGGLVVIVEDLYSGSQSHPAARQMAQDWSLARVFTESDYLEILDRDSVRLEDLTSRMTIVGRTGIALRLASNRLLRLFAPRWQEPALVAFRGGVHLQELYRCGLMRYKAIVYAKSGG